MKVYSENGVLTDEGEFWFQTELFVEFEKMIDSCVDENEARLLGSILSNYIGNLVSKKVVRLKK